MMGLLVNGESKQQRKPVFFYLIWLRLEHACTPVSQWEWRRDRSIKIWGEESSEREGACRKTIIKAESRKKRGKGICEGGFWDLWWALALSPGVLSTSQKHKPFRQAVCDNGGGGSSQDKLWMKTEGLYAGIRAKNISECLHTGRQPQPPNL